MGECKKREKRLQGARFLMYSRGRDWRDEEVKPALLCVHMEPGRLMRISLIARSLGFSVKEVKKEQWGQTLEALFGYKPLRPAAGKAEIGGEMAVIANCSGELLDLLFQSIRRNGMERPRLTAVMTSANRSWTCERLYRELEKEASALNGRR